MYLKEACLMLFARVSRFFALIALLASTAAFANTLPPDQLVKQITQETYVFVNQDAALQKGDTSKLIEWAEKSVVNSFDFNRMTSLAVGKDWRNATPEQKRFWFRNSANCSSVLLPMPSLASRKSRPLNTNRSR